MREGELPSFCPTQLLAPSCGPLQRQGRKSFCLEPLRALCLATHWSTCDLHVRVVFWPLRAATGQRGLRTNESPSTDSGGGSLLQQVPLKPSFRHSVSHHTPLEHAHGSPGPGGKRQSRRLHGRNANPENWEAHLRPAQSRGRRGRARLSNQHTHPPPQPRSSSPRNRTFLSLQGQARVLEAPPTHSAPPQARPRPPAPSSAPPTRPPPRPTPPRPQAHCLSNSQPDMKADTAAFFSQWPVRWTGYKSGPRLGFKI